jgi:hypothetical protein
MDLSPGTEGMIKWRVFLSYELSRGSLLHFTEADKGLMMGGLRITDVARIQRLQMMLLLHTDAIPTPQQTQYLNTAGNARFIYR